MDLVDEPFLPSACRRCGALILTGYCDGLRWRLAGRAVPVEDATVLKRYGVTPLVLTPRSIGLMADVWVPGSHQLAGRYLAAPHVCGAAINEEDL